MTRSAKELKQRKKQKTMAEWEEFKNDVAHKLRVLLKEFRISSNLDGYGYLEEAVMLVLENPKLLDALTKGLYQKVATEYETTWNCVERSIRHAIEVACGKKGNVEKVHEVCGNSRKKPTNGVFMASIIDYLIS